MHPENCFFFLIDFLTIFAFNIKRIFIIIRFSYTKTITLYLLSHPSNNETGAKSWIENLWRDYRAGDARISCNFEASSRRLEGLNTWPETRTPDLDILHRVLFPNRLRANLCSFAYKFSTADLYGLFYY